MKLESNWKQKSLDELEKINAGNPANEYSRLVNRVLELRKTPLNQFSTEDIRFMIGQNEGLSYCVTLSIDILKKDILAEGDFYPGDLLKNILGLEQEFWIENKILWEEIDSLIKDKLDLIAENDISSTKFYNILSK